MRPPSCPRPLSPADLLTIEEAVAELGMRRAAAVTWMKKHGIIRQVAGRQRVIWGDVLAAIKLDSPAALDAQEDTESHQEPQQRRSRVTIPLPLSQTL